MFQFGIAPTASGLSALISTNTARSAAVIALGGDGACTTSEGAGPGVTVVVDCATASSAKPRAASTAAIVSCSLVSHSAA